jgi:hypothetical protein
MAKTVTLASLRNQVRQRANMEASLFVTDTEVNQYINNSLGAFNDLLIAADASYTRKSYTFTLISGTATYSLPTDFRSLCGVEYANTASPTGWLDVRSLPFQERNRYTLMPAVVTSYVPPFRYFLNGSSVTLAPTPSASGTVQLWYIPAFTTLASDSDTVDGVNGLEEFVILDAAIKCLQKEESDVSVNLAQRAELVARIQAMAKDRDSNEPARVSDNGTLFGWNGGGGPWS